jgi:hypothetical protein
MACAPQIVAIPARREPNDVPGAVLVLTDQCQAQQELGPLAWSAFEEMALRAQWSGDVWI